ncbi:MAG: 50S ribosomal protein L4 [Planctomycetota bacterium]|nr:50S ribosomal protein L4 [Planctomycetota bacterium]MCX8040838.1 50S ribosomal protein L4 [Planctomycetota bacterium]MDW8372289.1 50S ribosomal protein L4 [Planctomycetota bacterium]
MTAIAVPVYDLSGAKTGEIAVDPAKFDVAVRKPLLKLALIAHLASQRQGTHKTKNRGEVAGGGKKPWRQKGTGRARQGSIRSPQWVGGGRAHPVRPRDYTIVLNAQERRIATRSALRWRLESGCVCAVEGLDPSKPKTRPLAKLLAAIGVGERSALIVSEGHQPNLVLSARNLPRVAVAERRNLHAGIVLTHTHLIFARPALEALVKELP